MKIFSIITQLIAAGLIIFNANHVSLNTPFKNQSLVALITILACAIAIVTTNFTLIKRIEKEQKKVNDFES